MAEPENKNKETPRTSEEFWNAVIHSGSLVIDCEFCGRTHFYDGDADYDEGELEGLREKQKAEPKKYISHSDDSISWGHIDGKQAVYDCPCNSIRKYEEFILNHTTIIANYLHVVAEKGLKEAKETSRLAKMVQTATNR